MPRFRVEVRGTYLQGHYITAKTPAEARRLVAQGHTESAEDKDDVIYERGPSRSWRVDATEN